MVRTGREEKPLMGGLVFWAPFLGAAAGSVLGLVGTFLTLAWQERRRNLRRGGNP